MDLAKKRNHISIALLNWLKYWNVTSRDLRIGNFRLTRISSRIGGYDSNLNRISNRIGG